MVVCFHQAHPASPFNPLSLPSMSPAPLPLGSHLHLALFPGVCESSPPPTPPPWPKNFVRMKVLTISSCSEQDDDASPESDIPAPPSSSAPGRPQLSPGECPWSDIPGNNEGTLQAACRKFWLLFLSASHSAHSHSPPEPHLLL